MNRYFSNLNRTMSLTASYISLVILIGSSWAQTAAASCEYIITNEWNSGFTAAIRISNSGSAPINGWTLSWRYNKDSISGSWNATLSGSNPYSATNLSWNNIVNPGQTIEFGIQGNKGGSAAEKPVVTGSACASIVSSKSSSSRSSSSFPSSISKSSSSSRSSLSSSSSSSVYSWSSRSSLSSSSRTSVSTSSSSSSQPPISIVSRYFANDAEAKLLWNGERTVTMPTFSIMTDMGLPWRVINAQRMLGLESDSIARGNTIDAAAFKIIDQRLADREKLFDADALRLPDYQAIWAPQFRDNLPQAFGVHVMVRVLDLLNRGPRQYNKISNECLLANVIPGMCGAIVDMGTTDGSSCNSGAPLREKQIIQMPELYSFSNVRRQITADELPVVESPIANTCSYAATLVHEFTHDADLTFNGSFINMQYDRLAYCGSELMSFAKTNSPFMQNVQAGTQNRAEYISDYAAGLINQDQGYRYWEDAAETVTAYVVFPEYFRSKAALNAKLKARYDYVKTEIFGGVEFRNLALENQALVDADTNTIPSLCFRVKEFRLDDIVVK